MQCEAESHEGLEKFAQSNNVDYQRARKAMIEGDAASGWNHLERAREMRSKPERACVLMWLQTLAGRGYPLDMA